MSLLSIAPDIVAGASGDLANLGSALQNASAVAAAQTTAVAAPAADEVSSAIAALFGSHAQEFQALSAEASAFHDQFVNLLSGGTAQYVSTEVANAQQALVNAVNAPAQALLGQPLIGGLGGAAANAAAPLDPLTQNYNFGPIAVTETFSQSGLGISAVLNGPFGPVGSQTLLGTFLPLGTGGPLSSPGLVAEVTGAATLNSPLGPVTLFSQTGRAIISPTGQGYLASSISAGPFSLGEELSASVVGGAFVPTGFSLSGFGLEFWAQGGQFGLVPLFLNPSGYVSVAPAL